ncbi:MAG: 16S rRNA (adenine(1518)-N(6)/adenine(1519)-N(6))-dimethyltransferase RsmA [Solirubrobacterales bacterium]
MTPKPGARQRRLGQNFLRDPNLLDAIVRDAGVGPRDVVLEVGGGGGALSERLAPAVGALHVVELDERLRGELEPLAAELGNVSLHWGDAMRIDLAALAPAPSAVVSNLPYSVATPLLLRMIETLPSVASWTVMVQFEIAERLAAAPSTRAYGSPSVVAQLACEVEVVRKVDPAVFVPRPRVASAILRMRRRGPAASERLRDLVRAGFAHRRKSLARSLDLAGEPNGVDRERALDALRAAGLREDARAESLSPEDFARFAAKLDL